MQQSDDLLVDDGRVLDLQPLARSRARLTHEQPEQLTSVGAGAVAEAMLLDELSVPVDGLDVTAKVGAACLVRQLAGRRRLCAVRAANSARDGLVIQ